MPVSEQSPCRVVVCAVYCPVMHKILNLFSYLLMLVVNYLSVSGMLGGLPIRALSDKYDNLFTPAPLTFSIWSVIYTLLLFFVLLQFSKKFPADKQRDRLFLLSCILNAAWVVVWQYEFIALSVLIMIALLYTLALLNRRLVTQKTGLLKITFGIYLGWICIATIANITALLVAWQVQPALHVQTFITIALFPIAVWILAWVMAKLQNPFPALAAAWAFYGIYTKRPDDHPVIAWAALGALAAIVITVVFMYVRNNRQKRELPA